MAQYDPRFEHRSGHHADIRKFRMCVFGSVAAPHCHDQTNNLAAQFQTRGAHRPGNDVSKQRIAGNDDIRAGNGGPEQKVAELEEKIMEKLAISFVQNGETRQRRALVAVKRRRNSPNTSALFAQLSLLARGIFQKSVWRVGHDGMNRSGLTRTQPIKTVSLDQPGSTDNAFGIWFLLCRSNARASQSILTARRSLENVRGIKIEIRSNR